MKSLLKYFFLPIIFTTVALLPAAHAQLYTGEVKVVGTANEKVGINVEAPTNTLDVDGSLRVRTLSDGYLKVDQNGVVSDVNNTNYLKKVFQYGPEGFNVPDSPSGLQVKKSAGTLAGHSQYGTFMIIFQFRNLQENFIFSLEKESSSNFTASVTRLPGRTTNVHAYVTNNPSQNGDFTLQFRPTGTISNDWHTITVYELSQGLSSPNFSRISTSGISGGTQIVMNNWNSLPQNLYAEGGKIGIGTDPSHTLHVNGDIKATKVITEVTNWADFVFEDTYQLTDLYTLEQYIQAEKHLPGIPSAKETFEGIDLAEMNTKLLQKVEELTLYVIELNKEIDAIKVGKE